MGLCFISFLGQEGLAARSIEMDPVILRVAATPRENYATVVLAVLLTEKCLRLGSLQPCDFADITAAGR